MSSRSSRPSALTRVWDDARIVVPDEATWRAMSESERADFEALVVAVFDEHREAMSEGVAHFRAKSSAAADLDGHFRRAGRSVFVACELAVLHPGEAVIAPDVLAVMDCDPDLLIDSWRVVDRGRGIDLVLEVRNTGKKHKDLIECVHDYARLRIPEYFSFDCRSAVLRGWRLAAPGVASYQPIVPQGGYLASQVLGLELAVVDARLRFFANQALVPTVAELLARVQSMADRSQQAAAESEHAAVAANEEAARARSGLAGALIRLCDRRGFALSDAQRARVLAETDSDQLARWLDRCVDARSAHEIFSDA